MVDMSSIASAVSAVKAATDIAKTMIGLRDDAKFQDMLIEFQSKVLDANEAAFAAQQERAAMLETIGDLKKEIAALEAWGAERQRYELEEIRDGVLAYRLKEGVEPPEPAHRLCANCFADGSKSILQKETRMPGMDQVLVCQRCGSDIYISGQRRGEHASKARTRR